jgi:hypothetical protein
MSGLVPYLSEAAIERDAAALLAEYAHARGVAIAPPILIEDIVEKHLKLCIEFHDTHKLFGIPRDAECNADILGAIFFDEARIVIDESLDPEERPGIEGRYRFTLAHEGGGHWRLHRHLFAKDLAQPALFGASEAPSFVCRSSEAKKRQEWQADFHASCLLMPRYLVFDAWGRSFGTQKPFIFDPARHATRPRWNGPRLMSAVLQGIFEPDHGYIFDQFARAFAPLFCVSIQAMRIRLEKLGLLLHEGNQQRLAVDV